MPGGGIISTLNKTEWNVERDFFPGEASSVELSIHRGSGE